MITTRRRFLAAAAGSAASFAALEACGLARVPSAAEAGRLTLRFPDGRVATTARGTAPLGVGGARDAILQMPDTISDKPMTLAVALHGASGSAAAFLRRLGAAPQPPDLAILAVDSRGNTWDAIRGGFGPDVEFLQRALEKTFQMVAVDPARLSLFGFSDGATYAISLGLINGDRLSRVVACSPGFVIPGQEHGRARFFISHGTSDTILPIDQCGRPIARDLKARGYDVTFHEFDGTHEVPAAIAADAFAWLTRPD